MADQQWWTDERIDELKLRLGKEQTFTEIARALGNTRSSMIGKAHRLGLQVKRPDPHVNPQIQRKRIARDKGARTRFYPPQPGNGGMMITEKPPPGFADPKPFIELAANDCHWPGPGEVTHQLLCCAQPVIAGKPYCAAHCRIAYNPASRPRL